MSKIVISELFSDKNKIKTLITSASPQIYPPLAERLRDRQAERPSEPGRQVSGVRPAKNAG